MTGGIHNDLYAISRALSLCGFLWLLKACLAWWYAMVKKVPLRREVPLSSIPLLGGGDVIVCAGLATLYMVLRLVGERLPDWAGFLVAVGLPLVLHVAMVVFSTVSWQVNRIFGWPLDIKHLRAADNPLTMGDSVRAYAGVGPVMLILIGILSYPVFGPFLQDLMGRSDWLTVRWHLWASLFGVAIVWSGLWAWRLHRHYTLGLKKNALIHFIQYYQRPTKPLDPVSIRKIVRDMAGRQDELLEPHSLHSTASHLPRDFSFSGSAEKFNVLLVLLESTPADYIDTRTAPNIYRLTRNSLRFANHFTCATETYRAVYSLLCSDYLTDVGAHPRLLYGRPMPQPSLAEVCRAQGYRTAFFHSGHLRYAGLDYFVTDKGFETVVGAGQMPGAQIAWMWGVREEDTVSALGRWIKGGDGRPFFAVYSTMFPHHPYYCPLAEKPFATDTWVNRYRNSLYYADQNIGTLLNSLEARGILDNTLVVVLADHGESVSSFPVGHGLAMTHEDMRVPFIVANRHLFPTPQASALYTNHLDVAPTLARLLNLPQPQAWLGRNLLLPEIATRMMFLTMPATYLDGIVDEGLLYALDGRTGQGRLSQMSPAQITLLEAVDPRNALAASYREKITLFRRWDAWRHVSRALARQSAGLQPAAAPALVG